MVQTSSLCRCICGTGKKDQFEKRIALGPGMDALEEMEFPGGQGCSVSDSQVVDTGMLSFFEATDQPLRGSPIREGELWYFSPEKTLVLVTLSLYVNGFSFVHGGQVSSSFSPFALVRNCKFQSSSTLTGTDFADYKVFKVAMFTQDICYYYGVRNGDDERLAEDLRAQWVIDISRSIRLVTQSLFPMFRIVCDPLEAVPCTHRRLMAGYLVHHDGASVDSVLYSELQAHGQDQAKLVFYENELCWTLVMEIVITDQTLCCEKIGINCSCFCIENHQFSSRMLSERRLWLRAVSNVKVKLQNRAPDPTTEELMHYRLAIKEHVAGLRAKGQDGGQFQLPRSTDALLKRSLHSPLRNDLLPSLLESGEIAADGSNGPAQLPEEFDISKIVVHAGFDEAPRQPGADDGAGTDAGAEAGKESSWTDGGVEAEAAVTNAQKQEFAPGVYRITAGVFVTEQPSNDTVQLGNINAGEVVSVLEVIVLADEQRVRGRIALPMAGWISLQNAGDGFCWAARVEGPCLAAFAVSSPAECGASSCREGLPTALPPAPRGPRLPGDGGMPGGDVSGGGLPLLLTGL